MRKRKLLLRGFPIWLFVLSLLFVGNTNVFGQKAITASSVTCSTNGLAGQLQTYDFTIQMTSPDYEWGMYVKMDFPAGVTIKSASSIGSIPIHSLSNSTIEWYNGGGHLTSGVSVNFTISLIADDAFTADYLINGDGWGADPHSANGTVNVNVRQAFADDCYDLSFMGNIGNYLNVIGFDIDNTEFLAFASYNDENFVHVPFSTDVSSLKLFFEVSCDADVKIGSTNQSSGVTVNDFTTAKNYSVINENGITRDYIIGVDKIDPLVDFSLSSANSGDAGNDTIWLELPINENLTSQVVEFEMYDAGYVLKAGTTTLESGVTAIDVSSNVVLTAVAGSYTKTYTLIVSQENPLNAFNFKGYNNAEDVYVGFPVPVEGVINLGALTIDLEVPYGTPMDKLIATYSGKSYVNGVKFGSTTLVSGTTPADYTNGGNLVLTFDAPAKATGITYAVNVTEGDPSNDNEILTVTIDDLTEALVWDRYGRKISGVLMYDSTKNVLPVLTISAMATVDTTDNPFNMPASGDTTIVYKVKSQSGAVAEWLLNLTVEEPSDKAKLTDFAFGGQIKGWFNDTLLLNTVSADSNLAKLKVTELEVSFGATITPSAVSPTTTDFTDPVTYTVTAQDGVTKTEYAAYVFKEETVAPTVSLTAGTFVNYQDTVVVKVTDASLLLGGGLALFHKDVDVAAIVGDKDAMDQAEKDGKAVLIEIPDGTTDGTFNMPTDNLISGIFYAYARDYFNNISVASDDSVVIVKDTVEVVALAQMTMMNVVYKYVGEATVTYAQSYKHQKYIQDASRGMLIYDTKGYISDTVVIGDAITNIYGKLDNYYGTWEIKPIEITKDSAKIVSRDNEVTPLELTVSQFNSSINANQNMLVKLTNMSFTQADASNYFTNGAIYDIKDNANGAMTNFRTSFYNVDYIGDTIPYGVYDIIGIKNVRNNGPVLTARNYADITEVTGYKFSIDPEEWAVSMVGVANDMKTFTVSNEGPEPFIIANAFIEGDPEFNMVNIYDVEVGAFSTYSFNVNFKPADFGSYESKLKVELTSGDVYEVTLTGVVNEPENIQYIYFTDFNDGPATAGWTVENYSDGAGFLYGLIKTGTNGFKRVGYNNPSYPDHDDVMLISPALDFTGISTDVVWTNYMVNAGYATSQLVVSTDNKQTWTTVIDVESDNFDISTLRYDLSEFGGYSEVYIGFHLDEPTGYQGSPVTTWQIDDFGVIETGEAIITPIFATNTDSIGMGVSDGNNSTNLVISNEGPSYFTLNSVVLKTGSSAAFTLADVPTEAVEVYKQDVTIGVNFDGTLGMQEATVVIGYTDIREGSFVVEVPVSAIGVGCTAPVAAVVGENTAPYAPVWYEFTSADDALITISSCGDAADTDVKVYDACGGNLIAANDDNGNCGNNKYSSEAVWAAKGGVTYKINWLATYTASGFVWTLASEDLPTGPKLVSVTATALNAEKGMAALTFKEMVQINPDTKGHRSITNGFNVNLITDRISIDEFVKYEASNSKDFTPEGDDEEEPNNGPEAFGGGNTFTPITLGTEDAPKKITGHIGASGDPWDWFTVTLEESAYIHAELDLADGKVKMWIINSSYSGVNVLIEPGATGYVHTTLKEAGTYYILIQPKAAAADPGFAYNLRAWKSQPPTFTVYRDMMKIAGPVPMAFAYSDKTLNIDQEYCYAVTQELYNGSESDFSNTLCATATAGEGDICTKSVEVGAGEVQTAPKTPYWYAYTPTTSNNVTISSDIPENGDPSKDWNDTMLEIFANCDDETPIYENDDVPETNNRLSELTFPVEAGVTYLIHWKRWAAEGEDNAYNDQPFFFSITEESMMQGDIVQTAFPVELPLEDYAGTTDGFNDDYSATNCGNVFMGEKDVCYTFTLPYSGTISGSIAGSYVGMHVIKGVPGSDACFAYAEGADGGSFTDQAINAGTYYIVVDHKLPFDSAEFVMNLDFTASAKQTVIFNVDMNTQIILGHFNPAVDTVDIVGTFNYWEHTVDLADDDGDGVYTYHLPTEYFVGEQLRYKYRINHDWDNAELSNNIDVYREWTVLLENNVTNDLYDNVATPTYDVTFKVVMSKQIELGNYDPGVDTLGLTVNVSGDVPELVDNDGTFIYETTVSANYGDTINYIFNINGTDEESGIRVTDPITDDLVITVWYNNVTMVGVGYDLASNVSVYPNPATTDLTVDFGIANTANTVVKVVDISGQVVKSIDINNRTAVNINVAEFAKGVYYLRITDGESVSIQKFVVQ